MEKVAVIILNWNGLELTKRSVRDVLASSYQAVDVYILDNGSKNNEATKLIKEFGNTVFIERSETNLGFAGGNNHVVNTLLPSEQYTYFLLLNQDTQVDSDCIERLVNHMKQNRMTAVCGPLVLEADTSIVQSFGADINMNTGKVISRLKNKPVDTVPDEPTLVDCVVGNCFMVRANIVQELGLFDEQYFAYYEEADWCTRVRQHGYNCMVIPQARISHDKGHEFRTYLNIRNMIWFEKKLARPKQLFIFWFHFWLLFFPERIKKGSPIGELFKGAIHGWLGLNKGKFN